MKLPTEVFGNVAVVHTPEDIDEARADQIQEFLCSLDRSNVVVDLDGTESIDSDGLAALLDAQEQLREIEGELKLATSNSVNRKILEITRLDQDMDVFDSLIDAVRSFD